MYSKMKNKSIKDERKEADGSSTYYMGTNEQRIPGSAPPFAFPTLLSTFSIYNDLPFSQKKVYKPPLLIFLQFLT